MTPEDIDNMVRLTVRFPDGMTMTFDIDPWDTALLDDVMTTIRLMLPRHSREAKKAPE